MKITLPLSQYFDKVRSDLLPLCGAVFAREEKHLDEKFKNKDVVFHANGFIDDDFDRLINNSFLEKLNSQASLLSFDLGPSCRKVDCPEDGYIALAPTLRREEILRIADKKITDMRKHFKGSISVENLDYHPSGAYETVCVPEFIYEFTKEFAIGLTLDIGHAEVTCNNLSMDIYDYLDRMPLSKLKEIHLTRSLASRDMHLFPTEKEYKILDFILKKVSADYIIIECYHNPDEIICGNKKLAGFLKGRGLYEN